MREVQISDVVDRCGTWNPRSNGDESFYYIDISSVDKDAKRVDSVDQYLCQDAPSRARQLVKRDDILVSTVRPNLNGVALVGEEHDGMTASTGYCVLRPKPESLLPRYLFHWVKTEIFVSRMVEVATGANYPAVSDAKVKSSKIPLPPLAEQKRIAAILDAADGLRARRRASLAELDTLLQSTFLEMFGDPVTNPMGWEETEVAELCENPDDVRCGPFGTQLQQHEFQTSGVPLWGIKHVNAGFDFETDEFVSEEKARKLGKYDIVTGDLVMTRKGTIGNCHIYPSSLGPGIMHSDLLRLRIAPSKANSQFIASQFAYSRHIQRQLELMSPGAVMPGINVTKLKKLQVETPPLDLQRRFAAIVESVEAQKGRLRAHLAELDALFASLQSRAFQGEL